MSTSMPIPSSGTTMSENRIAASTLRRRTGWSVTSAARSGVRHISRMSWPSLSFRYSGRLRPAWRMNQTGVTSGVPPVQASRKRIGDRILGGLLTKDLFEEIDVLDQAPGPQELVPHAV